MGNTAELETVTKAYDLTIRIQQLNTEIQTKTDRMDQLKAETFRNPPAAPIRKIEPPVIKPPIDCDEPFNTKPIVALVVVCLFIIWFVSAFSFIVAVLLGATLTIILVPYVLGKYKEHEEQVQASKITVATSPEYIKRCQKLEADHIAKQKANDELYQKQIDEWNTVIMPKYHEEKQKWTQSHLYAVSKWQNEIDRVCGELYDAEQALESLYSETKLIPVDYRSEKALSFIKQTLDTTDYDVKTAIEMYDRKMQMALDAIKIQEQQRQNELLDEQNAHAYMQNELLYQQNEIANKARKEANIAAVVSAVQRHNTNKYLKK